MWHFCSAAALNGGGASAGVAFDIERLSPLDVRCTVLGLFAEVEGRGGDQLVKRTLVRYQQRASATRNSHGAWAMDCAGSPGQMYSRISSPPPMRVLSFQRGSSMMTIVSASQGIEVAPRVLLRSLPQLLPMTVPVPMAAVQTVDMRYVP
jgi:hypothetical protein